MFEPSCWWFRIYSIHSSNGNKNDIVQRVAKVVHKLVGIVARVMIMIILNNDITSNNIYHGFDKTEMENGSSYTDTKSNDNR